MLQSLLFMPSYLLQFYVVISALLLCPLLLPTILQVLCETIILRFYGLCINLIILQSSISGLHHKVCQ